MKPIGKARSPRFTQFAAMGVAVEESKEGHCCRPMPAVENGSASGHHDADEDDRGENHRLDERQRHAGDGG